MMVYLSLQLVLAGSFFLALKLLRSGPPRLCMWAAILAMAAWLLPLPLYQPSMDLRNAPQPITTTLQVLAGGSELPNAESATPASSSTQSLSAATTTGFSWRALALALLVGIAILKWCFQRVRHSNWLHHLTECSTHLGNEPVGSKTVPVYLMPGYGAMTTGILRPKIWVGRDHHHTAEWHPLLLHEKQHIQHNDSALTTLIHVLSCLFWWNPVVLYFARQARFYLELSCDQACIRTVDKHTYQRALAQTLYRKLLNPIPCAELVTAVQGPINTNISRLKSLDRSFHMNRKHSLGIALLTIVSSIAIAFPKPAPIVSPAIMPTGKQAPAASNEEIPRVGQAGVEPPIFGNRVAPQYPKQAEAIGLQGYVILEAVLTKKGTVEQIVVLRGLGKGKFGFEQAASDALKQWEFKPGKVAGVPSDVRMTVKIDFVLGKSHKKMPVSSWFSPELDEDMEASASRPHMIASKHYLAGDHSKRNLTIPVTVDITADGQVQSFQPDSETMNQLLYPDLVREQLATIVEQSTFIPAKLNKQALATTLTVNLAIELGSPSSEK